MLPRVLEPEVMDTEEEAVDYDAMDHSEVNRVFVDDLLRALGSAEQGGTVLDVGTGTALIPIELCRRAAGCRVIGVDLAMEMLKLGERNLRQAGLTDRVELRWIDAKRLPFADGRFDVVMSNSIVHHIPRPITVLREMRRVLGRGGLLFVRDLLRPASEADVERLVRTYAGDERPRQQQLFRQSLHAALTVDELRQLVDEVGSPTSAVQQTSDRHWTLSVAG